MDKSKSKTCCMNHVSKHLPEAIIRHTVVLTKMPASPVLDSITNRTRAQENV